MTTTPKRTDNGPDIETLQRSLDDAQANLKAFESEASSIPEEIRVAAEAGDAVLGVALRQRYDAVPTHIQAACLLVARRSVALMEARLAEGESSYAFASASAAQAEAALQKVQAKVEEEIRAAGQRQIAVNSGRIALQQQKRALEDLLHASAQPPGLNVRSIWQAG